MKVLSVVWIICVEIPDTGVPLAGVDSGLGAAALHHVGRVVILSELTVVYHSRRSVRSLALSPAIVVGAGPHTAHDEDDDKDGDHSAGVAAPRVHIVNVISSRNSVGDLAAIFCRRS